MNPFYTSHRIGQLILKRSALPAEAHFFCDFLASALQGMLKHWTSA